MPSILLLSFVDAVISTVPHNDIGSSVLALKDVWNTDFHIDWWEQHVVLSYLLTFVCQTFFGLEVVWVVLLKLLCDVVACLELRPGIHTRVFFYTDEGFRIFSAWLFWSSVTLADSNVDVVELINLTSDVLKSSKHWLYCLRILTSTTFGCINSAVESCWVIKVCKTIRTHNSISFDWSFSL